MKSFRQLRSIRVAACVAVLSGTAGLASLVAVSSTAQADPVSTNAYVGVGADVTQDLFAGLSGASAPDTSYTTFFTPLHSSSATNNRTIQSFDADPLGGTTVSPGCVTTKLGGPSFDRPNSTTNGLAALLDAVTGTGWENTAATCTGATVSVVGQIDFARAARGVKISGSTLTFIPYARDGVAYLYFDHGTGDLASLTEQQIHNIYSSTTGQTSINGIEVEGCLPITGSTPRSNIESAVGVSDATAEAEALVNGCDQLQQNSGNAFYDFVNGVSPWGTTALPTGVGAIVPISAGSWIGQFNGLGVNNSGLAVSGGLTLGSVTNATGTVLGQPYTSTTVGSVTTEAPNTTYYQDTSFGYNLFTVVPTNKLSGFTQDAGLESLFVGTGSALCSSGEQSVVHQFGFDSLTTAEGTCGSTSLVGNG